MLNYMNYIYTVYQEKSFSKAAQKLFVSQPWLSAAIKKAEQEMKVQLFNRGTNPISLTESGEYYIKSIEQIMKIEEELKTHFASLNGAINNTLHIGSSMFFCTYVLPNILSIFRQEYPQISFTLSEGGYVDLLNKLKSNTLDFILETEIPDKAVFSSILLGTEQIILAVPADNPLNQKLEKYRLTFAEIQQCHAQKKSRLSVDLKEFANQEFLLLKKGNDLLKRSELMCKNAGFTPNVSMYLEQMMTAYYLSCEGKGLCFLRSTIVDYVAPTEKLYFYTIGDKEAQRNIYLSYKKTGSDTYVKENFISFMLSSKLIPF